MNTQDNAQESFIKNELKKFNITDAAITELSEKYLPLQFIGLEDKEGYKVVKAARMTIKNYRVEVDKRRKELNTDALAFQRAINEEARRITSMLEPIENHLLSQEKQFDEEAERIKREKEQAEIERIQTRINTLVEYGYKLNSGVYVVDYFDNSISSNAIKIFDDDAWARFIKTVKPEYERYQAKLLEEKKLQGEKLAAEEAERKAEQERLTQQRREQEMEQERLADIAHEQAKREAAFKAEQERINKEQADKAAALKAEQDRLNFEKFKQEETKRLEAEAVENAKRLAAEALEKEKQRIADEQLEKARQDLLLPDKEKITNFCDQLATISIPDVNAQEAKIIINDAESKLHLLITSVRDSIQHM